MKTQFLSIVSCFIFFSTAVAQSDSTQQIVKNNFYFSLGGGLSSRPFVDFQYTHLFKRNIGFFGSFNYMEIDVPHSTPDFISIFGGDENSLKAISMGAVREFDIRKRLRVGVEGGLSFVGNVDLSLGFSLKATSLYSFSQVVGLRTFFLINVNNTQPLFGIGASLCLGRLRPKIR